MKVSYLETMANSKPPCPDKRITLAMAITDLLILFMIEDLPA
jgi:hypothetical protein